MFNEEDVYKILNEFLVYSGEEVNPNTQVMGNPALNEVNIVDMVITLEDNFGIHIYDDDIDSLKTVQDVVDYIKKEMGE